MDLQAAPKEQLIQIIIGLQKQLLELQKENELLKKQVEKKIPPEPPFFIKTNTPISSKPKERQKRIINFTRKRETPTKIIKHAFNCCPDCGTELFNGWLKTQRQIIDIPIIPVVITEHQIFEHWCGNCHKKVAPRVDFSTEVLGNHRVSLRLMSFMAVLREQCRLPVRVIQLYCRLFHQLHLSYGEIVEILHTIASHSKNQYDGLKDKIRGSPVVCADETGWRENGHNGYLWNFNTNNVKYLLYRKSRGKQVVQEVIGKEFEGVLVSDFYASYNTHLGFHQRCWVHLLREMKKLQEIYLHDKQLDRWIKAVVNLYQQAKNYPGPDKQQYPTIRQQRQQRWKDQLNFRQQLLTVCKPYLHKNTPMTILCQRIDRFQDKLFMFIAEPLTPSDNNSAERSLRHSVIQRKISGGTRSEKGSQTRAILASLFGTWQLQNKNPFEECLNLLKTTSIQLAFKTVP
jgi:transposase